MKRSILFAVWLTFFSGIFQLNSVKAERLVIVGTGAGMPVMTALGEAFTKKHPGIEILIPKSIGSGGGIKAVGRDEYVLGRVARDITDKEKKYGLTQIHLARLPIVFYVNGNVSLKSIDPEQACRIYSGRIRRWEDISGGTGVIRVIRREADDSSLKVLNRDLPGFADITPTPVSKTTFTDQETVKTCLKEKNSIAYGAFPDVKEISGIRVLSLGNVPASDGRYPLSGPLDLVYKEKNLSGSLKEFIGFISSESARKAIVAAGGLPLK